ncbi:aldo/keto reductase [Streptomyces eurocidicus]|nr:hypothetical protein [Streptomyces eurocidicus]
MGGEVVPWSEVATRLTLASATRPSKVAAAQSPESVTLSRARARHSEDPAADMELPCTPPGLGPLAEQPRADHHRLRGGRRGTADQPAPHLSRRPGRTSRRRTGGLMHCGAPCTPDHMKVTPRGPLASGVLSGTVSRTRGSDPGSGRGGYAAALLKGETFAVLDVLERIARELGMTVAGVALAWARQQGSVASVPIGALPLGQPEDNPASAAVTPAGHLPRAAQLGSTNKPGCL